MHPNLLRQLRRREKMVRGDQGVDWGCAEALAFGTLLGPDIVNIVVPPHQTLRVLERAAELGIENVWVQPGAEDEAVLDYLEAGSFAYLARACIMVQARVKAAQ